MLFVFQKRSGRDDSFFFFCFFVRFLEGFQDFGLCSSETCRKTGFTIKDADLSHTNELKERF